VGFYDGVFLLSCLLILVFSNEYSYRIYEFSHKIGIAMCALLTLAVVVGFISIGYSIGW
jgi:hypothetical protein